MRSLSLADPISRRQDWHFDDSREVTKRLGRKNSFELKLNTGVTLPKGQDICYSLHPLDKTSEMKWKTLLQETIQDAVTSALSKAEDDAADAAAGLGGAGTEDEEGRGEPEPASLSDEDSASASGSAMADTHVMARALFDCPAEEEEDLEFSKGDEILITAKVRSV